MVRVCIKIKVSPLVVCCFDNTFCIPGGAMPVLVYHIPGIIKCIIHIHTLFKIIRKKNHTSIQHDAIFHKYHMLHSCNLDPANIYIYIYIYNIYTCVCVCISNICIFIRLNNTYLNLFFNKTRCFY